MPEREEGVHSFSNSDSFRFTEYFKVSHGELSLLHPRKAHSFSATLRGLLTPPQPSSEPISRTDFWVILELCAP